MRGRGGSGGEGRRWLYGHGEKDSFPPLAIVPGWGKNPPPPLRSPSNLEILQRGLRCAFNRLLLGKV